MLDAAGKARPLTIDQETAVEKRLSVNAADCELISWGAQCDAAQSQSKVDPAAGELSKRSLLLTMLRVLPVQQSTHLTRPVGIPPIGALGEREVRSDRLEEPYYESHQIGRAARERAESGQ